MLMPKDYNNVSAYGEFVPLKLGGHICKVMNLEETESRNGKPMVKIYLDIAEGEQKGYYAEQYKQNTYSDKKWGCIVYQLIYDNDGNTHRGFKTFITCIENSNNGFKVQWGDNFVACFKDKLIGGVFGREQYLNRDGEKKFSTKCVQFRSTNSIRKGVPVPDDKLLNEPKPAHATHAPFNNDDFEEISDNELPF